jgi:hypothetical protein
MSVEATIRNLLAESRKLKESMDDNSVSEENVATKNATAPEGRETLDAKGSPSNGSGDNEDNKRNNVDDEDEACGGTSKKENPATKGATAPEGMSKIKGESVEFDMSADVDALFNGEEGLTEEFRAKAETIFEAAVVSRVKEEVARIEESYEQKLEEQFEEIAEGLIEHVNGYLDLMVEQWKENNEVALESSLKNDILEGFVTGLKNLFTEHYIEVPEEKYDVVGAMEEEINALASKLDEITELNVELHKQLGERLKAEIVAEQCDGLSDVEADKFKTLAEEITFEDADSFTGKLTTIRENYFKKSVKKDIPSIITEETIVEEKEIPAEMKQYVSTLSTQLKS